MENENTGLQMSTSIKELAGALSKAKFKPIIKDATNPFFNSKYATLDTVIEAVKDGLSENGLAVTQLVNGEVIDTVLMHTSGEWIASKTNLCAEKRGPQGQGSAITYARRYAISAILSVASEADDDGHIAEHQKVTETSTVKSYEEMSTRADTLAKWRSLEKWLKEQKASAKLMKRYNDEMALWETAKQDANNGEGFMDILNKGEK